jgi:hypothetical protein
MIFCSLNEFILSTEDDAASVVRHAISHAVLIDQNMFLGNVFRLADLLVQAHIKQKINLLFARPQLRFIARLRLPGRYARLERPMPNQ